MVFNQSARDVLFPLFSFLITGNVFLCSEVSSIILPMYQQLTVRRVLHTAFYWKMTAIDLKTFELGFMANGG